MNKKMICIICPKGCHLNVESLCNEIKIDGNSCIRGEKYAIEEINNPQRNIASTILIKNGKYKVVSVATSKPIAKEKIEEVMTIIKKLDIEAPVKAGQIVYKNIDNDGTDIIVTRDMERK